jgi:hypothetical protein
MKMVQNTAVVKMKLKSRMSRSNNLGVTKVSKITYTFVTWKLNYTDICNTQFFLLFAC